MPKNTAKKQYHHFFPIKSDAIKNNVAYRDVVNNVVNIVFMDALTNDQISNRNPSDYITQFKSENPSILHKSVKVEMSTIPSTE